jgi:hypothetical protein
MARAAGRRVFVAWSAVGVSGVQSRCYLLEETSHAQRGGLSATLVQQCLRSLPVVSVAARKQCAGVAVPRMGERRTGVNSAVGRQGR